MLFSAYRKDDYASPEGFFVQCGEVLSGYAERVIRRVTDPRTGIQSNSKFPPNLAEVIAACDAAVKHFELMDKPRRVALPRPPRQRRDPSEEFEVMFAKYGRPLGPNEKGTKWEAGVGQGKGVKAGDFKPIGAAYHVPTDDELRAHYGRRDIAAEAAE